MRRRDLTQSLLVSAAGVTALSDTSVAQAPGAGGYQRSPAESSVGIAPVSYEYPVGDLRRYGGDPSGIGDSSTAFKSAVAVGLVLIPANSSFRLLSGATRTGRIAVKGFGPTSQLLCDGAVLTVTGGTGSVVEDFQMLNITEPWIISRDASNWNANPASTLRRSNDDGYQPTINDHEVWQGCSAEQQNQQIGPRILFHGDASNITVSRISGRFVLIALYDTCHSVVQDCDIRGGKGASAAICFWNINGQIGRFNRAARNSVRHSSFSGIAFARNVDFQAQGNSCIFGGESGIKTWQGVVAGKDSKCVRGQIQGNSCRFNYYDGIDAMSDATSNDEDLAYHQIQSNYCHGNGGDGINCNGQFNQITDNHLSLNGRFGLWGTGLSLSKISGNFCVDNNQSRKSSQHDLCIVGNKGNNIITDNFVWAGKGQNNYGIYAPGSNFVGQNSAVNGAKLFFGKPGPTGPGN